MHARLCGILAVLVVALVAAIPAAASYPQIVDYDSVATLGNSDFEFKNGDLWWGYDTDGISAHLFGDLKLNNADGWCARMRMEYFDDSVSIATKYGGIECGTDNRTYTYSVDLNPYVDPDTDLVKVSVQKEKASSDDWTIVESAYFKPTLVTDKIKMTSDGVDFGDEYWGIGAPTGSGTVEWEQGEGMNLTPHIHGTLYLNNVAGLCARLDIEYDADGAVLTHKQSGRACAPDNGRYAATIDTAPYTSDRIVDVLVTLQTQSADGSWHDVPDYYAKDEAMIDAGY
jgi:hypothetical protein